MMKHDSNDEMLQVAYDHFFDFEDCSWCCTHLDAATLALSQKQAMLDGFTLAECDNADAKLRRFLQQPAFEYDEEGER